MGKRYPKGNVYLTTDTWTILETELEPVCVKQYLAGQSDKNDQKDETTTTSRAGSSPTKTKSILQPIEKNVKHQ